MEGTWENPGADVHPPAFLAGARGSRSRVTDCEGPGRGAHIPAGVPVIYRKHNGILPQRRKCAVRMCNYSSRIQTKPLSLQSSLELFITRPGAAAQPRCGAAWLHLVPPYSRRPLGCWHCPHTQHWLGPRCGVGRRAVSRQHLQSHLPCCRGAETPLGREEGGQSRSADSVWGAERAFLRKTGGRAARGKARQRRLWPEVGPVQVRASARKAPRKVFDQGLMWPELPF